MLNSDDLLSTQPREDLEAIQLRRLRRGLETILASNPFYRKKFADAGIASAEEAASWNDFFSLPFTTKSELSTDQAEHPPYGSNLTYPRESYSRVHQTSGTKGEPLRWLDTEENWQWVARCWLSVYAAAGVSRRDRIFIAFSFGPFLGFWSAQEAARLLGALIIPGGGMTSLQRLKALSDHESTVLICTPTYALHLAEVAEAEGIDLSSGTVRATIQAGEPGASLPATKARIEAAWGARCYDHAGATEVGPWGYECAQQDGLHVNEAEFIAEVIDPLSHKPAQEGELVLTNLGREGSPVIRYRTGDRVKLDTSACPCGRRYHRLSGGIIGRIDDAIVVRGINIYPSSIENIVRRMPEIGEFAVDVRRADQLDDMEVRIEVQSEGADERIAAELVKRMRNSLGLRVKVTPVRFGSLPRFDLKARRFTDHRRL